MYAEFRILFVCIYLQNCFMKISLQSSEQTQMVCLTKQAIIFIHLGEEGLDHIHTSSGSLHSLAATKSHACYLLGDAG